MLLGICRQCGTAQYPLREVCLRCLSDAIDARETDAGGIVLAGARVHRSLDPAFAGRLPLEIVSVKLDAGPVAIVFGRPGLEAGARVRLRPQGEAGQGLLVAED